MVGGIAGAILANVMLELPLVTWSATTHAGAAQLLAEQQAVAVTAELEAIEQREACSTLRSSADRPRAPDRGRAAGRERQAGRG